MTASVPAARLVAVDDARFLEAARLVGHPVPVEQSPAWDRFDAAVSGREHAGRFLVEGADGRPIATVSLSRYAVRGRPYLWAKHGPILLAEPTPELESTVRAAIVSHARSAWPDAVFVRLHALHAAPELRELLQSVTFDHTIVVDLTRTEDEILAGMSKRGRYKTRKVIQDADMTVAEEHVASPEDFAELYAIYQETAGRDGFGIFPAEMYLTMLSSLGEHARLFVARRHDRGADGDLTPGRAVSWVIAVVYDGGGTDYYAAGNAEARDTNAALALKWHIFTTLKAEGVRQYDLMGVGSERAPQLMGVREFKQQFGEVVPCAGAWDVPLKPAVYAGMVAALRVKRWLRL